MSSSNIVNNEEFSLKNFNLENAKNLLIEEINSERRFEEISDFESLIKVLLDRDALSNKLCSSFEWSSTFEKIIDKNIKKSDNLIKPVNLSEKVVDLISEKFFENWKELGLHLKLTDVQLNECKDVKSVLNNFQKNCIGISEKEIYFRLNRSLEKCSEVELQLKILKLLEPQIKIQ